MDNHEDDRRFEHQSHNVPVIYIDATQEKYQAGLKTFTGVEKAISEHPDMKELLATGFPQGEVVLRGIHRFAPSQEAQEQIIQQLLEQGIDRNEGQSGITGEMLHIVAAFAGDPWQGMLAYTTESEADKKPKDATRTFGIVLVYDNSDGSIVYIDYQQRRVFSKEEPATKVLDMAQRDEHMVAVIAEQEGKVKRTWKERLQGIVVIEYPFIPRQESKLKKLFKRFL